MHAGRARQEDIYVVSFVRKHRRGIIFSSAFSNILNRDPCARVSKIGEDFGGLVTLLDP